MASGWKDRRAELVRQLGRILIKTGALQFGAFTLASGKLSSYYVDLRMVPSFPDVMRKAVEAYIEVLKNEVGLKKFDAIGGIPTAGLTYASVVAHEVSKPLIYMRKEEKGHGRQRRIEGVLSPGWRVVVLDDLATTGTSLISALEAVRAEGGEVTDAVVLIDRLEGAKETLRATNVKLHSLTSIIELTNLLYKMGLMEKEQVEAIRRQIG